MPKLTKQQILGDLINNIYCRLKPSKTHGIGVFAIRDIPKGTDPFRSINQDVQPGVLISAEEIEKNPDIHPEVKKLVFDFYAIQDGIIEFPNAGLNELTIAFCMNTGPHPNMGSDDRGVSFQALRDIKAGEELLVDYATFSD